MSNSGVIFNIQRFSVNDGPGIRTTVFMKGCPLNCPWCHNPEGKCFDTEKLNGKTIGKSYTVEELFCEIEKDRLFYDESGGGVTFSGGEPLSQPGFLNKIISKCKREGIHTAIDTSGYADQSLFKILIKITDIFLYDLKLIDPVLHLKYTGVSNTEILENLEFLIKNDIYIIIRIPLIPGIVATDDNMDQIRKYLMKFEEKMEIKFLPYHEIAKGKYDKYGLKYQMPNRNELSESNIKRFIETFKKSDFDVKLTE